MKELKVRELVGTELKSEDAIIVKGELSRDLLEKVVLDFEDIDNVPGGFFANLLTDLISTNSREQVAKAITVKNLANVDDFKRVLLGTSVN